MKKIIGFTIVLFIVGSFAFISTNKSPQAQIGLNVGQKAPELAFSNPSGKTITLSSLKGHMVLIDYWASWCGPCRRENPAVVAAYKKYQSAKFKSAKGFKIYSVSLDQDKNRWMNAIKQDKLEWSEHVSDLKGWKSAAAAQYKVNSIPASWLIDENGIIVAKNLRGAALDQAIDKYVKSFK